MPSAELVPWLLSFIGMLIMGISVMIYRRMGVMENTMHRAIDEQRIETRSLHTRITDAIGRIVRLETRCDTYHGKRAGEVDG